MMMTLIGYGQPNSYPVGKTNLRVKGQTPRESGFARAPQRAGCDVLAAGTTFCGSQFVLDYIAVPRSRIRLVAWNPFFFTGYGSGVGPLICAG